MNIMELAKQVSSGEVATNPMVSLPLVPVEEETEASQILEELTEKHGFERSDPSMEYQGSITNEKWVRRHVRLRYGDEESDAYEPCVQVKPKTEWLKAGYLPIEGEKPLCQVISRRGGQWHDVDMWHQLQMRKAESI